VDKCGRERECEEETHADRMRQKKQTTERHSDRELRGPVQQPTLFLPLFPLRDPHEARLRLLDISSLPLLLRLLCVSMETEELCLQMIASPAERLSWRQYYSTPWKYDG